MVSELRLSPPAIWVRPQKICAEVIDYDNKIGNLVLYNALLMAVGYSLANPFLLAWAVGFFGGIVSQSVLCLLNMFGRRGLGYG